MTAPKVVAISGSLRQNSYSTAVARSLTDAISGAADTEVVTLGDVPLYNQDLDTDTPPEAVTKLREAIKGADLLIIVSPEYNYSMSGVLKNAMDWASRPYGKSAFAGVKTVFMTCSPAFTGGARAQASIREVLFINGAHIVQAPEIVLGSVHEKIVDGVLADEHQAFPLTVIKGALGIS